LTWKLAVEPRNWQRAALNAWVSAGHRGIIEVVTGAGKTVFAEMCIELARSTFPGAIFVITVPTLALLDQWYVSLQEELQVSQSDIATYSGEGKSSSPAPINIMTLNTAREAASRIAQEHSVVLIVDECHRIGSPVNAQAMVGEHVATIGMSATPEREYDSAFEELVVPALGPVIYSYDYNQAHADGVIAPFDLINVAIPLQPHEREEYEALSKKVSSLIGKRRAGYDVEHQLTRLLRKRANLSATALMRIPVAVRLVEGHRGERVLIFHEQIRAAEIISERLAERRHRVALYHSKIDPALRRSNLRMYRRGQFDTLVSCRALDEGVNIPETTVAVVASSTASSRQRIQRLGRVLRPAPGKDRAVVYTLYATEVEERRLLQEAESLDSANSIQWMKSSTRNDG
jgi:superfamily II DNA or RNA helicase